MINKVYNSLIDLEGEELSLTCNINVIKNQKKMNIKSMKRSSVSNTICYVAYLINA